MNNDSHERGGKPQALWQAGTLGLQSEPWSDRRGLLFRRWKRLKCGVLTVISSDFNLIISTSRGFENDACSEVWYLLGEIGDQESVVEKTGISGLVVVKTVLDSFEAVSALRRLLGERSEEFRHILRVIPVEAVVPTRLEEIGKVSHDLSQKISENETFRVTVEKRHTQLSTRKIVETVAENISRQVNLEHPDKIVLVEVLGSITGVSVIKPDDILSVVKERAS